MNEILIILKKIVHTYQKANLVVKISIGLIVGILLGLFVKNLHFISLMGELFVGALKAIAPILVFALVSSAMAQGKKLNHKFGLVILLYLLSTFLAAVTAVATSFMFPQTLVFSGTYTSDFIPSNVSEVLKNLIINIVANPAYCIVEGKYLGILFWALIFGIAMKNVASRSSKKFLQECSDAISKIVELIIDLAPFGIMGLIYQSIATNGLSVFKIYGKLILLIVGTKMAIGFIVVPLLVFLCIKQNPFPLVWHCMVKSGITAFFVRSSAANIPVNMSVCEGLKLDKELYSVSIPLGATINMNGAAATIAIMTLAAAHTVGISVDIPSALILSLLGTLAACGASGVAGGSLLLIPMACSLFGISQDIAMQVVAVGFVIGVVQDSFETALNSATDVVFTATADYVQWKKEGKKIVIYK
ncbi:serine/threonine transporter SstT [bacterium]|nr:serine/threonine transporter SstT [bacterium]